MNPDTRWKQRFQNFEKGFFLLREAVENGPGSLNKLEQEGVIQRFEYTFELAWKSMKDYLEENGVVIAPITPRQVVKDAFAAKLIEDGQIWIDMLNHRNLLSHPYDFSVFEKAVEAIAGLYLPAMASLQAFLAREGNR